MQTMTILKPKTIRLDRRNIDPKFLNDDVRVYGLEMRHDAPGVDPYYPNGRVIFVRGIRITPKLMGKHRSAIELQEYAGADIVQRRGRLMYVGMTLGGAIHVQVLKQLLDQIDLSKHIGYTGEPSPESSSG